MGNRVLTFTETVESRVAPSGEGILPPNAINGVMMVLSNEPVLRRALDMALTRLGCAEPCYGHGDTRDCPPGLASWRHVAAVGMGGEARASRPDVLGPRTRRREAALGVPRGRAPWPAPRPRAGRLGGSRRAVRAGPVRAVVHPREPLRRGGPVACARGRAEPPGAILAALAPRAEARLGRRRVPSALAPDRPPRPLLSHRPPPGVACAAARDDDRSPVPWVAGPGPSAPPGMRRRGPDVPAPRAHRRVREQHAARGPELFDSPRAQAAAEVQPDPVAADRGRDPRTLRRRRGGGWVQAVRRPYDVRAGTWGGCFDNAFLWWILSGS
jgi:hypothetical protein